MTPAEFRSLARQIAGPRWKTRLGPMIGRSRWMVRVYATGEWAVPETVGKLMQLLVESSPDDQ